MKKLKFTICMLFVTCSGFCQTFYLLGTDAQGDNQQSFIADIKYLSYNIDIISDSLWFQIETFNAIDPLGDVGFMIGFDTNLVITDGLTWNGGNTSMNYDQSLLVFQDYVSPGYYGVTWNSSGSPMIPTTVSRPDSFTFIIRVPLSQIDNDGHFNLIAGSGGFDIASTRQVLDDSPENSFYSVSGVTGIYSQPPSNLDFITFPNPVRQNLVINNSEKITRITLFNSNGELICEEPVAGIINVGDLSTGYYFLKIVTNGNEIYTKAFLKN